MRKSEYLSGGDVFELTLRGERRTAVAMLVSDDDAMLIDLVDGDRPVWARPSELEDVVVFRPECCELEFAAA